MFVLSEFTSRYFVPAVFFHQTLNCQYLPSPQVPRSIPHVIVKELDSQAIHELLPQKLDMINDFMRN